MKFKEKLRTLNWKKHLVIGAVAILGLFLLYILLGVAVVAARYGTVNSENVKDIFSTSLVIYLFICIFAIATLFCVLNFNILFKRVLKKNDLENARWLTFQDVKVSNTFTLTSWDKLSQTADGLPIYDNEQKKESKIILTKPIHSLIVGTTGSGKTTGFINPVIQILAHCKTKPSLVISDPKGELLRGHGQLLSEQGYTVKVLNLREVFSSSKWNPFKPVIERLVNLSKIQDGHIDFKAGKYVVGDDTFNTYAEAKENAVVYGQKVKEECYQLIKDIVYTVCPISNSNDHTWQNGARDLIFALALGISEDIELNIAEPKHLNFYNIYKNISENLDSEADNLKRYFSMRPDGSKAPALANTVLITQDRTLSSFLTDVNKYAQWFNSTSVQALTSKNEMDFSKFDEEPTVLFIVVPDEKDNLHSLATLMIQQLYKELVDKANQNFKRGKTSEEKLLKNVYFLLDEFGNLPKIEKFDSMITVGRSRNIFFNLVVQDYNQLFTRYGDKIAQTIKSNCNIKIFLGTTDKNTIEEFSSLCGKKKIKSLTLTSGSSESSSAQVSVHERPLIYPSELEKLNNGDDMGNAICLCFGYPPLKAKFTLSFNTKKYYLSDKAFELGKETPFDNKEIEYDINTTSDNIEKTLGSQMSEQSMEQDSLETANNGIDNNNNNKFERLKRSLSEILALLTDEQLEELESILSILEQDFSMSNIKFLSAFLRKIDEVAQESENISLSLLIDKFNVFYQNEILKQIEEEMSDENSRS